VLRQDRSLSSGADDRDAHHPLGIGEILDTGIKIYRANAATLIKLVLVVVAPVAAVGDLITASADSRSSISFDRAPERMNGLRVVQAGGRAGHVPPEPDPQTCCVSWTSSRRCT
jgi:hypothetical protein